MSFGDREPDPVGAHEWAWSECVSQGCTDTLADTAGKSDCRAASAQRLVPLLEDFDSGEQDILHAVFIGPGRQLPQRVRVFIDFLIERLDVQYFS
jgi:DNA-binding transcriptional LysR family regulator